MKRIDVVENVSAAIALARGIAALPPLTFENLRLVGQPCVAFLKITIPTV